MSTPDHDHAGIDLTAHRYAPDTAHLRGRGQGQHGQHWLPSGLDRAERAQLHARLHAEPEVEPEALSEAASLAVIRELAQYPFIGHLEHLVHDVRGQQVVVGEVVAELRRIGEVLHRIAVEYVQVKRDRDRLLAERAAVRRFLGTDGGA